MPLLLCLVLTLASAQTPSAELVDQAIGRIETGDYEGALLLLDDSRRAPSPDEDRIAYLTGVTVELDGDPSAASDLYREGLDTWPDSPLADDRRFRLAESMATMGEPRRALRQLRRLDDEAFTGDDAVKLDLVTGIALLEAGRDRRGTRLLSPVLTEADAQQVTFYQAKARIAWARMLALQASELSLNGREKKVVKRLEERATLLAEVETQVVSAAHLQEPEWVLEGLLILGRAYESVADDLLASTRPRGLTDSQLAEYTALLEQRALVVFTKASRHYGSGLAMATRLGWKSRRVGELSAEKRALDARIETLDSR